MSTYLKTAAMSLLSKTLQTFLYKYLSDVDVEGVALPSVYDGSGWGVRLSNVKLREGVQLMEHLPGTIKKKRRRKRKGKTRKNESSRGSVTTTPSKKANGDVSNRPLNQSIPPSVRASQPANRRNSLPPPPPPPPFPADAHFGDSAKFTISGEFQHATEMVDDSLHFDQTGVLKLSRSRASSTDEIDVPLDDALGYVDDSAAPNGSRPSTPLQDSKSIFSCFTNTKSSQPSTSPVRTDTSSTQLLMGDASWKYDDDNLREMHQLDQSSTLNKGPEYIEDTTTKPTIPTLDGDSTVIDEEHDETDEEYEEYEQPYRLCLGDNGRIGTLDIRLVGKELHVRVEDAVLTIEAYPISEQSADDDADSDSGDDTQTDDMTSTASATSSTTKATTDRPPTQGKKNKPEFKRDTVGDRVLADNPLARAIAAIPHLFLRDIRIRFIIRKDSKETSSSSSSSSSAKHKEKDETTPKHPPTSDDARPGDTMLQVGIEFLSVSNGDDALSHFQEEKEDGSQKIEEEETPMETAPAYSNGGAQIGQNVYMVRHIRTGRGPAGGIWVQIFAPGPKWPPNKHVDPGMMWARQRWVAAAEFYLLRCSGLDVRARIHMGTKKELASSSWFYDNEESATDNSFDGSTLDSMLLGIDNVVPGPQYPRNSHDTPQKLKSPPVIRERPRDANSTEKSPAMYPGAEIYSRDDNNIQSCNIPSTFHRVSRGLLPGSCKECTHLPFETCSLCWEAPAGCPEVTQLDNYLPMPGLALQFTLRDPLELNVDRSCVETLNLLKTLFAKKPAEAGDEVPPETDSRAAPQAKSATIDSSKKSTASTGIFAGFLSKTKPVERDNASIDAFAPYFQPESIQIAGIHVTEILLRIHVMKEEKDDTRLSFCYWDVCIGCVSLDHKSLKAAAKTSHDVDFAIGYFSWDESQGTGTKRLVSFGISPMRDRCDSSQSMSSVQSLEEDYNRKLPPWPTTASALLDVPPPLETLLYKDRERHGLQIRFISVACPESSIQPVRSMVNARLGIAAVHVPWGIWRDINDARKQIMWGILGKPNDNNPPQGSNQTSAGTSHTSDTQPSVSSLMNYSVQVDGGVVVMAPVVDIRMPLTRFSGERSSESGIFFETLLNKLKVAYGQTMPPKERQLTLQQLALLPENVRLRIILFLKDLRPLEEALEAKRTSNPFHRTRAVNKSIVRMAKKMEKSAMKSSVKQRLSGVENSNVTRRQKIMKEMLRLDDQELDQLWSLHLRHQRKLAKKSS